MDTLADHINARLKELLTKPFESTEALLGTVQEAIKVWGKHQDPLAVCKTSFHLEPDNEGWKVKVKLDAYGALTIKEGVERVNLDEIEPTHLFSQSWEAHGPKLDVALTELRWRAIYNMESVLGQANQTILSAERILKALKTGQVEEDAIWASTEQAEDEMAKIVERSKTGLVATDQPNSSLDPVGD